MPTELHRHVDALVSDFAATYGSVDLVGRRVECAPDEYDAVVGSFESFGVVGGGGVRIVRNGEALLARYDGIDGWIEPGGGRRPGESYAECAKRGVRRATGLDPEIGGLAQLQIVYLDDRRPRPPIPNPYVSFEGSIGDGEPESRDPAVELRWTDEPPAELAYGELAELSLGNYAERRM